MKAKNYNDILRARGFKCMERSDYQGINVYTKEHKFNKVVCYVEKDTHGKGQTMTFNIYNTLKTPKDMVEFKEQEFDRGYLYKEATKIHEAFEQLKLLKSPKHIYF